MVKLALQMPLSAFRTREALILEDAALHRQI